MTKVFKNPVLEATRLAKERAVEQRKEVVLVEVPLPVAVHVWPTSSIFNDSGVHPAPEMLQ